MDRQKFPFGNILHKTPGSGDFVTVRERQYSSIMESFCHVGGRQGSHPQYGQNCVVYPGAQNCAFCGADRSHDVTGPTAKPTEPAHIYRRTL